MFEHLDAGAGVRAAAVARDLLRDMPTLLTVLLVSNNAANWAASLLAQVLLIQWGVPDPEAVGTLGVSVVLFLLAESAPKQAFRRARETLLYPTLPVLAGAHALLRWPCWPVTRLARWLSEAAERRMRAGRVEAGPREALVRTGAREGFLTPFQERVARGVLALRGRSALEEARAVEQFPRARVGVPGVEAPPGTRDQRVLVLDSGGDAVVGWVPMARLCTGQGFRAARRRETQPVLHVDGDVGLDVVYRRLDRLATSFAVVAREGGVGVVDVHRLRRRLMGAERSEPG